MKPSIGRIVHFVQKQNYGDVLVHLPAVIVAVWDESCVNLQVFTDGGNTEPEGHQGTGVKWITSVSFDDAIEPQARTWHWPEKVNE